MACGEQLLCNPHIRKMPINSREIRACNSFRMCTYRKPDRNSFRIRTYKNRRGAPLPKKYFGRAAFLKSLPTQKPATSAQACCDARTRLSSAAR